MIVTGQDDIRKVPQPPTRQVAGRDRKEDNRTEKKIDAKGKQILTFVLFWLIFYTKMLNVCKSSD